MRSCAGASSRLGNWYRRRISASFGRRQAELKPALPTISFTFDDFPKSALRMGGAVLQRYGVTGTYYASLGMMNQDSPVGPVFSASDLECLLAAGHELGCHTFSHCDAWVVTAEEFERSILDNGAALGKLIPGSRFETQAYPFGRCTPSAKHTAQKYFRCCRGGGQMFNGGPTDLNNLQAFFLEQSRDNPAAVKAMIDQNRLASGWLIFATHDICESPSRFGCTPQFFEEIVRHSVQTGARVLPVAKALQAICSCHS